MKCDELDGSKANLIKKLKSLLEEWRFGARVCQSASGRRMISACARDIIQILEKEGK